MNALVVGETVGILKINNIVCERQDVERMQSEQRKSCTFMPGDILFLPALEWIGKLISWSIRSEIVHCAMLIDSGHLIEAKMGVPVKIMKITYKSYVVKRVSLTNEQKMALVESARKFVGKRFNYFGMFVWFLMVHFKNLKIPPFRDRNRVYCSELVDLIYQSIGIDLVPTRPPGDVLPTLFSILLQ